MTETTGRAKAGGISIHAVDVSRGIPASGLFVRLRRLSPEPNLIAEGACAASGHFMHPVAEGENVLRGTYEVEFDVGAFFREAAIMMPDPSFLNMVVFQFGIDAVQEHFHLPFKFTPWGFSLFRGGA